MKVISSEGIDLRTNSACNHCYHLVRKRGCRAEGLSTGPALEPQCCKCHGFKDDILAANMERMFKLGGLTAVLASFQSEEEKEKQAENTRSSSDNRPKCNEITQ